MSYDPTPASKWTNIMLSAWLTIMVAVGVLAGWNIKLRIDEKILQSRSHP